MTRDELLWEFDEEMAGTRRMLDAVPEDKLDWRPHEKSFTLGRLANHVAAFPGVVALIVRKRGTPPVDVATKTELLEVFSRGVTAGREAIAGLTGDQLAGNIFVTPTVEKPFWKVLRGRIMNHLIHHRGQLSVYLRLLNAAVPGMYGASADEK